MKILTSLHGRLVGLDARKRLIAPAGIKAGVHDVVTDFDDFLGDLIADEWGVTKGSDLQTVDFAVSAAQNGMIRATTGDDAAATMAVNGVQLHKALNWKANQRELAFEARVKISAITTVALFVGLTDQLSSLEMPINASGSGDGLSTTATDAVGFMFDTSMATDTIWGVGVANDVDATAVNSGLAFAADTYRRLRMEIDSVGTARFFIDGGQVGAAMTGAVTASVALTPVLAAFSRAAASRNVDVDYVLVQARRA